MFRRLWMFASAGSVLLLVSVLAMWPRTRWTEDTLRFISHSGTYFSLSTAPGGIVVQRITNARNIYELGLDQRTIALESHRWGSSRLLTEQTSDPVQSLAAPDPSGQAVVETFTTHSTAMILYIPPQVGWTGFSLSTARGQIDAALSYEAELLMIPFWFLTAVFAVIPSIVLRQAVRRSRRRRLSLCQHCGYDLRASPSRCPECGAEPAT